MSDVEQIVRDAEEVNRFLENETIKRVFRSYDEVLWRKWKESDTPADREALHARARAFDDLARGLRAVVDSGKRETHELERANRPDIA